MYPRSPRAARAFWLLPLPRGLKDLLEKLSLQCLGLWGARGEEQWLALPQFPLLGGAPVSAGLWMWISPAPSKGSWAGGSALVFGSVWPQLRGNKRGHRALINPSPGNVLQRPSCADDPAPSSPPEPLVPSALAPDWLWKSSPGGSVHIPGAQGDKRVPAEFQPPSRAGLVGSVAFSLLLPVDGPRVSSAGHRGASPAPALRVLSPGENKEQDKAVRARRAKGGRGGHLVSAVVFLRLC